MSHEDIAAVWSILSGRQDVDTILRELIGTHFLTISLARRDNSRLREAFLFHIVSLRVIFDLQRTYLQSAKRSTESTSSLLPQESLFSALLHLLDVIVTGCISCSELSSDEPYNKLTSHTTLAGLRALLLHKTALNAREYDLLNSRFEEIYERGHWHGSGYTLTLRICRQAIQALASPIPEGKYGEPTCSEANLPDFFTGLYLLKAHEKSMINASRRIGVVSLQSSNWFCDLLAMYDLFWSTTAAMVQLRLMRRHRNDSAVELPALEDTEDLRSLELVLSIRDQLQQHVHNFSGSTGKNWIATQLPGLMLQDMHRACAESHCQCFEAEVGVLEEKRLHQGFHPFALHSPEKEITENLFDLAVSEALRQLRSSVERRSATSMKPQSKVTIPHRSDEASLMKRATTLPHHPTPRYESFAAQHRPPLPQSSSNPVLGKPGPIPASSSHHRSAANWNTQSHFSDPSSSENTINSDIYSTKSQPLSLVSEDQPPSHQIENEDDFPEVSPRILAEHKEQERTPIVGAVECFPEVYNSDVQGRLPHPGESQSWQPEHDADPEVATPDPLPAPTPSIRSQESDRSSSHFYAETPYSKPKRWQLFGPSRNSSASSVPSFAFFASGNGLLIWNDAGAGCYDLDDILSLPFRRINATGVCAAAGGSKRCVIVVRRTGEYRVEVYEGNCEAPIRTWKVKDPPYAIAMSRNDNYVAAKFSRSVKVFQIDSNSSCQHNLPSPKGQGRHRNHLIAFSNDSTSFVATTRYEPEKVITYWSECTNCQKSTYVEGTAPTGFANDNGLSSLICANTSMQAAFLATFTEKSPPSFLSLKPSTLSSRPIRDQKGRIGTRIHQAALCPQGTNLVMLNQRNDLFWIDDCWTGRHEPRRVGTLKRSVSVLRDVELAMPNSDEVHLFWLEKGKGMLVTMGKGGGKTKPIELVVDLEELLFLQRLKSVSSS